MTSVRAECKKWAVCRLLAKPALLMHTLCVQHIHRIWMKLLFKIATVISNRRGRCHRLSEARLGHCQNGRLCPTNTITLPFYFFFFFLLFLFHDEQRTDPEFCLCRDLRRVPTRSSAAITWKINTWSALTVSWTEPPAQRHARPPGVEAVGAHVTEVASQCHYHRKVTLCLDGKSS